ncbi:LysR family transcriptional regulator [Pseudooceanicola nanhaiensis]|uniref:LysR family transcriptional regulator n=1 Tax=Pseudooceanicola nanhaiensis TaxID=375761 RepID=UPI001CD472BF|nr:LysR family transcriptional regulator [Pseudooceanicola nanhaiensis]MCA0921547.1 LysR family transcriptional regulator [Pseudooceanicola nanhaiensis]
MQFKWLEDFVALAEMHSFSEAAARRNVTQPAFGRRIRALEDWLGVPLVDRDCSRLCLTAEGKLFLEVAVKMIDQIGEVRSQLTGDRGRSNNALRLVASHTLAVHFCPEFVEEIENADLDVNFNVAVANSHEAVLELVDGKADLSLSYHYGGMDRASAAMVANPYKVVARDVMVPVSAPMSDAPGAARHALPGTPDAPVNYLGYASAIVIGRAVNAKLESCEGALHLKREYSSDMAEALKTMILSGRGMGWLPLSAIRRELKLGLLVSAAPCQFDELETSPWSAPLEVRLYRRKDAKNPRLERLWRHLEGGEGLTLDSANADPAPIHAKVAFVSG